MARRSGLTRELVVDAAVELVDREGPGSLSLTELAARLGVKPPSLYNHVDGLDALRRELRLRGLRDLAAELRRAAVGRAGREAMVAAGHAYRAYARAHPGLYALTLEAPEGSDEQARRAGREVLEVILAILRGYGLEGDEALHATRLLRSALHGFVALEASGGFALDLSVDRSFERLLALLDGSLEAPPARAQPRRERSE